MRLRLDRVKLLGVGFFALSTGVLTGVTAPAAASDTAAERGAYTATIAGCTQCHTPAGGAAFSGGTVLDTPFGKLAVPNITQDKDTGIGDWTKADFEAALRQGLNKDGQPLYPAMPYLHYTEITDGDIDDLWAYMETIPAVSNAVEVNRLPFPFDVRASLYGWQALYFTEGRFTPHPDKSAAWNRGAYMIEALAHCGACHTPRDAMGGPLKDQAMQGAAIEEWYAPDISGGPNSVIKDWSMDRLVGFLSGDDGLNHVAVGSMALVVDDLSKIKREDVVAVATYLKDQPSDADQEARAPQVAVSAAERESWTALFNDKCSSCHQTNGEGVPGLAASLVGSGAVLAQSPHNVISVLLEGIAPSEDFGVMPSFRELSNREIAQLANHVRISWGNDAPANANPMMVQGLRQVTETAPGVAEATSCPNVPAARLNDEIRAEIAKLAAAHTINPADVETLVGHYAALNPDVSMSTRVGDLSGTYCRDVAASGASKTTVVSRQVQFMNSVVAASARSAAQ
ncbi:MAG: cytochrome c [Pseudomonadota bacterium]